MRLDNIFGFGKFKGLTLRQVYQGTNQIDKDLIRCFLKYKIEKDGAIMALNETFLRIDTMEIDDTCIKVELYNDDYKGNWSKNIESLFSESMGIGNFLRGNTTLDEFYTKNYRKKNQTLLIGGNPGYIDWIIKKLDKFWFSNEVLIELMALDVFRFAGIKVTHLKDNVYEYVPHILTYKYSFPKKSIELNDKKSYASDEDDMGAIDYEESQRNYYRRENARNTFDALTDGQIGSYDDWLEN